MAQKIKHKIFENEDAIDRWKKRKDRPRPKSDTCIEIINVETRDDGSLKVWYKETDIIYQHWI